MPADRELDRDRYERLARDIRSRPGGPLPSVSEIPAYLRAPYDSFVRKATNLISLDSRVLEIGAGIGTYTEVFASLSESVVAVDISQESLGIARLRSPHRIHPVVADMAALPFADDSFDILMSAGSLSYGDPDTVNSEIWRVLRPGATLLIVDSLNHNPVYRLNRWINYRRGLRTRSTMERMPTTARLDRMRAPFRQSSVEYFGKWLFLHTPIARLRGTDWADKSVLALEDLGPDRLAFKVVVCATGFDPNRVVTA